MKNYHFKLVSMILLMLLIIYTWWKEKFESSCPGAMLSMCVGMIPMIVKDMKSEKALQKEIKELAEKSRKEKGIQS